MPMRLRNRREKAKDPDSFEQLPAYDEERLGKLFDALDKDANGRISANDVLEVFSHVPEEHVKETLGKADTAKTGNIDFAEFVRYIVDHEKRLALTFSKLDQNKDGILDAKEIMSSFQKLGLKIDETEARRLLKRMDASLSLTISFEEFRDYFLWYPSTNVKDLFGYWRHSAFSNIAEDSLVPDDLTENELTSGMWWRHLVAGGIAGCVSRTATAPIDRIKTFFQVYGKLGGMKHCVQMLLKEGGYLGLWRGNGMNVLKIAPESAIKFMSYEQMKKILKGDSEVELNIQERILAGAGAGAISQSAIYPMEVIKTRLTLRRTGEFDGIFHAARKIYRNEGLRAFYRGYAPNLIGILPYAGIDLAVYEVIVRMVSSANSVKDPKQLFLQTLKRWYISKYSPQGETETTTKPPAYIVLGCGVVSSVCGQLSSYPLALVKTKLQASSSVESIKLGENSTIGIMKSIVAKEGLPGLYRGMGPNFMKAVPAVSISYVVYEHVRDSLGVHMT